MDTSKEYILMCEKGFDDLILLGQTIGSGTIVKRPGEKDLYIVIAEHEINYAEKLYKYDYVNIHTGVRFLGDLLEDGFVVWYQDQLQEMIAVKHGLKDWFCWVCTMSNFNSFCNWYIESEADSEWKCYKEKREYKMPSMEQLWLAFVMKEKYNKTWNGTDWKIDD